MDGATAYCTFMCPPRSGMTNAPPTIFAGKRSYKETDQTYEQRSKQRERSVSSRSRATKKEPPINQR